MKKVIKKLSFCFLLLVALTPFSVFAKDDSLLYEKLYKILGEDGRLKIENIKSLNNNYLSSEISSDSYDVEFSRVISSYIYNLPEVKKLLKDFESEHPTISVFCKSYSNCGISINYDSDARGHIVDSEYPDDHMKHYDVEIVIDENVNRSSYDFIKNKFSVLDDLNVGVYKYFYLYDLSYINMLYNLHNNNYDPRGSSNTIFNSLVNPTSIANNFPEVKKLLVEYPSYDVRYAMWSNMGGSNVGEHNYVEYTSSADFVVYYNNTAYLRSTFVFSFAPILFIDENEVASDEKIIEVATNRIKGYINNDNVNVEIQDITNTFNANELNSISLQIKDFLNKSINMTYNENAKVYSLRIGEMDGTSELFIVKTSKQNISELEVQAIEKNTGIKFTSNSISLPIDTSILVNDKTDSLNQLNKKVVKAFDINLFSNIKAEYIKSVIGGLKIYIPVDSNFDASNKQIAYLNENGEILEKFDITVEKNNNQTYVTFVTNHLSTYGIVDNNLEENVPAKSNSPQTGEMSNIFLWTVLMVLFAVMSVYTMIYLSKRKTAKQ